MVCEIKKETIDSVHQLRKTLNACAELSGAEIVTASTVINFLQNYHPDELIENIGGLGIAAIYNGPAPGPTVMIRCELDAIPDSALNTAPHVAVTQAAHRCGHDGHMAIVAGLAGYLVQQRPRHGRVVLLFQPAEETGQGALDIIEDEKFQAIQPDFAMALHNVPGYPMGSIVLRNGVFSSASTGCQVKFTGIGSHACEPEKARAPTSVLGQLLLQIETLTDLNQNENYTLATITHAQLGQHCFGSAPDEGMICTTIRAGTKDGYERLKNNLVLLVQQAAQTNGIQYEIEWLESFPENKSDNRLVEILRQVCQKNNLPVVERALPFRWSEDFGHFSSVCPTLFFGLGIGESAPGLHHPDYYFPNEALENGIIAFIEMAYALTNLKESVFESQSS